MTDSIKFEHFARPWTTNAERRMHHQERARLVREWREAFGWLGHASGAKQLNPCHIEAIPTQPDRRWKQDVGACLPAVKAAIDGLVDAGVLDDDTPDCVLSLRFWPAVVEPGGPSLRLWVAKHPPDVRQTPGEVLQ